MWVGGNDWQVISCTCRRADERENSEWEQEVGVVGWASDVASAHQSIHP